MPVLGPLVAYVQTPRNESGRLNEAMLETLIRNAAEAGVNTIGVLGSVGGAAYLPRSMRKKVISLAVKATDGKVPIMAGVGALTTAEVALNLGEAAELGASGALLQPMSYQPLLPHEVTHLYEQASSVARIPLWVYNNPATTRHTFSMDELAHIAQLEHVAGFKDRAANTTEVQHRIAHVSKALGEQRAAEFDWGFSGETKGALVLGSGATSWHSALAGIMPSICVELADAAVEGRTDPEIAAFALQMQRALNPLTVIMTQYGGIRVAHAIGLIKGLEVGQLPQPLQPLPAAIFGLVDLALRSVEQSLRSLQEQLVRGGIPAAKDAVMQGSLTPEPTRTVSGDAETAPASSSDTDSTQRDVTQQESPQQDSTQKVENARATTRSSRRLSAVSPTPVMTRARIRELSAPTTRSAVEGATRSSMRERAYEDQHAVAPVAHSTHEAAAHSAHDVASHEAAAHESAAHSLNEPTPAHHVSVEHSVEEADVLALNTGPQRVSAKARIQDEAQRSDIARVAKNILLSGDPDIDQTRVNLERIVEPIIKDSARDTSNYVPRRARGNN